MAKGNSLPELSAASERNWSIHDFIHSKRRNRLKTDKAEKLVSVYSNIAEDNCVDHLYFENNPDAEGWLGSQDVAIRLMGLGVIVGLWNVLHPVNMLGIDRNHPMAQQLAGMGMVSLKAIK